MDLTASEQRVLGCLLEKQRTTPDAYPLTLNALRLACNQATNRDPVVDYDEESIRDALQRLSRRRWVRFTSGHGSRVAKYRHLLDEALGLGRPELAVLCVLLLRGPQTPGELKGRSERLHAFGDLAAVEDTLGALAGRGLVVRLERRPGHKEQRYAHLLGEAAGDVAAAPLGQVGDVGAEPSLPQPGSWPPEPDDDLAARVARLERELQEVRSALEALRGELGS
jgi:hypothetical protein